MINIILQYRILRSFASHICKFVIRMFDNIPTIINLRLRIDNVVY
jgi:hypothetical protein